MYPPGQGAFLAFGEWLFHEPWVGVVISVGLMFAATCWMLQAWLPSKWALFGTLLAMMRLSRFTVLGVIAGGYVNLMRSIPLVLVEALMWKRRLNLPGKDKEAARQKALQLFPAQHALLARKKDHGRGED